MRCLLGHNWKLILGPSNIHTEGDGMIIEFSAYMRCMTCHIKRKLTSTKNAEIQQLYMSVLHLTIENIKDKNAEIMNLRIRLQILEKENARLKEWKARVEERYTKELEDLDEWIANNNKDAMDGSR